MKKKVVKNRKIELRKKRIFFFSLCISIFLFVFSIVFSFFHFFLPYRYISPLPDVIAQEKSNGNVAPKTVLQHELEKRKISYIGIKMQSGNSAIIQLDEKEMAIVSFERDISLQIASLQLITSRLTMEGKQFSLLDLRYDKPVITF